MDNLGQAKILGGVGAILMVLSIIPNAGMILWLVGLILVLIAVKQVSDLLNEKRIFNNVLTAVIVWIVGSAVGVVVGVSGLFSIFMFDMDRLGRDGLGFFMRDWFPGFALTLITALLVVWVSIVVSSIFLRQGLIEMGSRLGVGYFSTAGLLYLIGAILTIILIGFILLPIASIILAVAFFTMPEKLSS